MLSRSPITCFIATQDWEGLAGLLLKSAEKLARAGAEFTIRPANTVHEAFKFLEPRSPIPWLHIVEVVCEAATGCGWFNLGILGTKFLMEGNLYKEELSERGIEAVVPEAQGEGEDQCPYL